MSIERVQEPLDWFQERVWKFYRSSSRDLPWRRQVTAYGVFVSEVMLQQTQVGRVLGRWERWLKRFDGFDALAVAPVTDVLQEWQGLGYNRRALWLRAAAQTVVRDFAGELPREAAELVKLPGVGPNTAGSLAAFAYNVPAVFIETNIRRVFLHEFFADRSAVTDGELRPLVEAAMDRERPREWYWALMDYGAALAKRVPNPNRRSKSYKVQSRFEGSRRQLRGEVLRRLLGAPQTMAGLQIDDAKLTEVLQALAAEGFVQEVAGTYRLSDR
jgi:A/G-specific adenine glycosylase